MSPSRTYSRGVIGYPSVLLLLGALAMWLLWPKLPGARGPLIPARSATVVKYLHPGVDSSALIMSPILFARSSRVGFGLPERTESVPDEPPAGLAVRPRFLSWPDVDELVPDAVSVPDAATDTSRTALSWPRERTFQEGLGLESQVHIEVSAPLAASNFRPRELAAETLLTEAASGMAVLFVELNAQGRAEHVFLERGTEDDAANAQIVRAVVEGRGLARDGGASGRVTVSWGGSR